MKKYYFTGYLGEAAKRMLNDLLPQENIYLIDDEIGNRYIRFLYYRIQDIIGNMNTHKVIKTFFYQFYRLYSTDYKKGDLHRVIFFNSMFNNGYDVQFIRLLKRKHPGLQLIMYIVDPSCVLSKELQEEIVPLFDLVYAINKDDCKRFGYRYYPLIYSKVMYDDSCSKGNVSDIYYLGSGFDRTEKLHELHGKCIANGVTPDFRVMDEGKDEHRYTEEITYYNKSIDYNENLKQISNTNCMLELMHQGFDNPTQRYLEAVTYNKKLLTNNVKVKEFAYYDPKYIQIFQDVRDIDWQWVKIKENVDYEYKNDFSPILFLERIDKDLSDSIAKEHLC